MPKIDYQWHIKGVFVTDNVYYVGLFEKSFYLNQDDSSKQTLNPNYYASVIYSSDMSLTSCYSMPSTPASTSILILSMLGTPSTTSIYTISSETFVEDLNAYYTRDID